MAGTQFSSDRGHAGPGRASSGKQDRRVDREQRQAAPRPHRGQESAGAAHASGPGSTQHLGHPVAPGQSPEQQEQPTDFRHVQLLSQHVNMQGLGREAPFGVRTAITGEYRSILDRSQGQVPFDVLEDV
jgi:hypothetical protein